MINKWKMKVTEDQRVAVISKLMERGYLTDDEYYSSGYYFLFYDQNERPEYRLDQSISLRSFAVTDCPEITPEELLNDVAHFEQNLKVGDKVLVTKPKGDDSLWSDRMDFLDGEVFTIRKRSMLHFWKVYGCPSAIHEGWLTKVESEKSSTPEERMAEAVETFDEINAELQKTNEVMKEIVQGLESENKVLADKLRDIQQRHNELLSKHSGVNFLAMTPMNHIYRF